VVQEKLIRLCAKKDRKAQSELYEIFSEKMFRLCFRYTGNTYDSEDILADGFIKIFENIENFKAQNENSLEHWIKKIMVNECLMFLRRRKKIEYSETEMIVQYSESIDDLMNEKSILKSIMELPDGYRTVFNMYVIEGFSHKEIGAQLKISEQTSKSQLSRAKAYLREILKSEHNERRAI
jgi:RNA polymerase sigma-70 factor (ECF subfamily)